MKKTIVIMDCVDGTSTNAEGYALFLAMKKIIAGNHIVVLSLKGCTPMSSSFLNSSIGALIDEHGLKTIKGRLLIKDATPVMAANLKQYLTRFKKVLQK